MFAPNPLPASDLPFPKVPDLIFANWLEELNRSGLSPGIRTAYGMAVRGYLEYCTHNALSVTTASARAFMEDVLRRGLAQQPQQWKDGLNWFFATGQQRCGSRSSQGVPTLGRPTRDRNPGNGD